ncbi:hypothetical protein RJT34_26554 [Clitoria ternatea]|uniref:Uncharacterized protein n=1 Tax=Clitoria ternatea TaxID=43366 RepID=A0AAN9FBL5_CLITE
MSYDDGARAEDEDLLDVGFFADLGGGFDNGGGDGGNMGRWWTTELFPLDGISSNTYSPPSPGKPPPPPLTVKPPLNQQPPQPLSPPLDPSQEPPNNPSINKHQSTKHAVFGSTQIPLVTFTLVVPEHAVFKNCGDLKPENLLVDEHGNLKSFTGLGSRVIKLVGLSYDDGAMAEDEDLLDVVFFADFGGGFDRGWR